MSQLTEKSKNIRKKNPIYPKLISLVSRSHCKPLKRLQTNLPLDKPLKYEETHSRPYKGDSSLLSFTSNSPPLQTTIHESTTSTYLENSVVNHEHDSDLNPMSFSTSYHPQFYSNYASDPSTMIYNSAYTYMNTSSNQIPSTSTPMHFNPYGRYQNSVYPTNNYNTASFF